MKVFISWSGEKSQKVAIALKDWLPKVIQSLDIYVSSEDIDKGARWNIEIAKELNDSNYGILCVTKESLNSPWLNFEAGALSKSMNESKTMPFLFDMKPSDIDGPLKQFQHTLCKKDDIKKLIQSLNKSCVDSQIKDKDIDEIFEMWYPKLDEKLEIIRKEDASESEAEEGSSESNFAKILEELLEINRDNQKLLTSKDGQISDDIKSISHKLNQLRHDRIEYGNRKEYSIKHLFRVLEMEYMEGETNLNKSHYILMIASTLKDIFPWIYEETKECIDTIKKSKSKDSKVNAIDALRQIIRATVKIAGFSEMYYDNDLKYLLKDYEQIISRLLLDYVN